LDIHWQRCAQYIQDRAVRVDHFLEFGEFGSRCAAFQIDHASDFAEAGAHIVFHREEAAQIEQAVQLD
jgi:hypothetical protein